MWSANLNCGPYAKFLPLFTEKNMEAARRTEFRRQKERNSRNLSNPRGRVSKAQVLGGLVGPGKHYWSSCAIKLLLSCPLHLTIAIGA